MMDYIHVQYLIHSQLLVIRMEGLQNHCITTAIPFTQQWAQVRTNTVGSVVSRHQSCYPACRMSLLGL